MAGIWPQHLRLHPPRCAIARNRNLSARRCIGRMREVFALMLERAETDQYASRSLAELARLAQQGQREAFRHIVERCNQRLYRAARSVLKQDADAQDALQEAYVNAFRHIDSFRGDAELTTWLTRIVLNECYHHLRGTHAATVDIEQLDTVEAQSPAHSFSPRHDMEDPCNSAARAQIRELIEQSVSALPEAFRAVFMLRDIEQCSVQETADALDIRPETVKTRLFRARRLLRHSLQAQLSSSLADAFPFLGTRCATLTERVMARLAALPEPQRPHQAVTLRPPSVPRREPPPDGAPQPSEPVKPQTP